jgi:hypothetical protein
MIPFRSMAGVGMVLGALLVTTGVIAATQAGYCPIYRLYDGQEWARQGGGTQQTVCIELGVPPLVHTSCDTYDVATYRGEDGQTAVYNCSLGTWEV